MPKRFAAAAVAVFLVFIFVQTADAGMLYGTVGKGSGVNSTLVEIDPTTGGLIRTIGSVGYTVNGLACDPTSGKLYASTSIHDATFNGLIEINLATGAGTPVGVPGWGLSSTAAVTNLAFDSTGMLFGWWDPSQDDLVSIDKTTGVATRVGESGTSTSENGLAFDKFGSLWMVNFGGPYYSVNPATGAATYVGNIGDTAHHGVFDLDTNLYYGISDPFGSPFYLRIADLSTGTILTELTTVDELHTLAFSCNIPEPGTFVLMGMGLLGLAGVALRRRRRKAAA